MPILALVQVSDVSKTPRPLHPIIRLLVVHERIDVLARVCESLSRHPRIHAHGLREAAAARVALLGAGFDGALVDTELLDEWGGVPAVTTIGLATGPVRAEQAAGVEQVEWREQDAAQLADRVLEAYARARAARRRETLARWLQREAHFDHVTGLLNRTAFDERLAAASTAAAETGMEMSLVLADVDRLGEVNRDLGYRAGDEVLRHVGASIVRCIRAEDTAARLGGDEFGVILPDSGLDVAKMVARRIGHDLDRANPGSLPHVSLTFSLATGRGTDAEALMAAALARLDERSSRVPLLAVVGRPEFGPGPGVA